MPLTSRLDRTGPPTYRRISVASLFIVAAIGGACAVAEFYGHAYLSEQATWLGRAIAEDQRSAASYERLVFTKPLAQNAAVWYRLAFEKINQMPDDTARLLDDAVRAAVQSQPLQEELVRTRCREVWGPRVRQAFRCTHCNWELTPTSRGVWREASVLGRCLVIVGDMSSDWETATESYVDALAFASDLSQADFEANLEGIIIAKIALQGLVSVITSRACVESCLDRVSARLTAFANRLPTVTAGLRLATWRFAIDLHRESLAASNLSIGLLSLRSKAIAAWRLSREQSLILNLVRASANPTAAERVRLNAEIRRELALRHSGLLMAPIGMWAAAMTDVEDLQREFKAVLLGISIERFHARNGSYPDPASATLMNLGKEDLKYERSLGDNGYTISKAAGPRTGEIIVKQPSSR